ncbi:MAG: hypothetical protein HYV60_19135 [Planctomycetia bacterium]|nr:hypothetical protein [Planctomycetia bacterium]
MDINSDCGAAAPHAIRSAAAASPELADKERNAIVAEPQQQAGRETCPQLRVLEERRGDSARLPSADLMQGRIGAVLYIVSVSSGLLIALAGGLYIPLDLVHESTTMTDPQHVPGSTAQAQLVSGR